MQKFSVWILLICKEKFENNKKFMKMWMSWDKKWKVLI